MSSWNPFAFQFPRRRRFVTIRLGHVPLSRSGGSGRWWALLAAFLLGMFSGFCVMLYVMDAGMRAVT